MEEIIDITLSPEIRNNPKKLAELIVEISEDIENCKNNLGELRDRNWFKRTFSNNTRDMAEVMINQNETISSFLTIIQGLIFLNMNNLMVLASIQEELNIQEKGRGNFSNKYIELAKQYLNESITSARKVTGTLEEHKNDLERIKEQIIEKNKIDQEQNEKIDSLNKELDVKGKIDQKQSENIQVINEKLQKKEKVDETQSKQIETIINGLEIKDKTDKNQSEQIKNLHQHLEIKKKLDEEQSNQLETLQKDLVEKMKLDNQQSEKIEELKSKISEIFKIFQTHLDENTQNNLQQGEKIKKIEMSLDNLNVQITNQKIGFSAFESKLKNIFISALVITILNLILLIYFFVK